MRNPTGSEVKWAECSIIIGIGYRVQVFAASSIAQSVCEWTFGLLAIWCLRLPRFESCIQQRRQLVSFGFKNRLLCQSTKINNSKHILTLYIFVARSKWVRRRVLFLYCLNYVKEWLSSSCFRSYRQSIRASMKTNAFLSTWQPYLSCYFDTG